METGTSAVKRKLVLEGLDCANCAMKIENGVQKIDGVSACSVNFANKTLTMELVSDRSDDILEQTKKKFVHLSRVSKYWNTERREAQEGDPSNIVTLTAMITVPKRRMMGMDILMTTGRKASKSWSPG